MPDSRTVLLADDHALVRAGLRALIEASGRWRIVAEAANGDETLQALQQHRPRLLMLDLNMPRLDGLRALPLVQAASPQTRVLVVSMDDRPETVIDALAAGARGYLPKDAAADELHDALEAVASGRRYIGRSVSTAVIEHALAPARSLPPAPAPDDPPALTARQLEVLRLLASGHGTKQIAFDLGLSVKTVESHRAQIMQRLQIRDLPRLVLYAVRHGLVSPDV
jgi:DNA-binding NarL/FixJ family response regulator